MKILLLGPGLDQVGGVSNYYNVIKLHEHKAVDYFTINAGYHQNLLQSIKRLSYNYIIFTAKLISNRYKIIHLNPSLDKRSFFRDAIFIIIARIFKKKVIVFFRGWQDRFEDEIKTNFFKKLIFSLSFAKADVFIVLGDLFKNKLLSLKVNPTSNIIIETTIAEDSFIDRLNLDKKIRSCNKRITFLFMARVLREKGIYIAIDAFYEIYSHNLSKDLEFIISGDGPELQNVQQYVRVNNIKNIKFTGFVSGKEKHRILLKSHILLFPTYYGEGLPNCILEAMLYGMPIITRSTAAIPDWVKPGVNGLLTNSLDHRDMVPLLQKLVDDKNLYKEMAKKNYDIAQKFFTKDKVKERIIHLYKECCD